MVNVKDITETEPTPPISVAALAERLHADLILPMQERT